MAQPSPFTDVKSKPLFTDQGKINGSSYLKDLRKLSVGVGGEAVKADRSGLWAGANRFADAPFKINMLGQLFAQSTGGQIQIDTPNNRIVIYDASGVPRILIGFQFEGF